MSDPFLMRWDKTDKALSTSILVLVCAWRNKEHVATEEKHALGIWLDFSAKWQVTAAVHRAQQREQSG